MNSLDRAFIRAYARDLDVDSLAAAAADQTGHASGTVQPRRRAARPTTPASGGEPLVEVSYADGTWYRIEQPGLAPAKVTSPHLQYEDQSEPESPASQPASQQNSSARESTGGEDIDLMARFRPPLFRDVNLRSHDHAVEVKAQAIAAHTEAMSPATIETATAPASMPSLDYTLAPPSPPVAPQVPLTEFSTSGQAASKPRVAVSPFKELAQQTPAPQDESPVQLSTEELEEYAAQCQHLRSVLLELSGVDNLDSPEEAHVMLVDVPLELIESEAERDHKRLLEEEVARQREEMLTALMQQELIVGDAYDAQWLYGSEPGSVDEACAQFNLTEPTMAEDQSAVASRHVAECFHREITTIVEPGETIVEQAELTAPGVTLSPAEFRASLLFPIAPQSEASASESSESESIASDSIASAHDLALGLEASEPATEEPPTGESTAEDTSAEQAPQPAAFEEVATPADPPAEEVAHEQQESTAELSAPVPFQPAWEVDRIVWPVITDQLLSDASEQFHTAIEKFQQSAPSRMVAITGHQRGEGRTTLAICLARIAAQAGLRVALVDADFDSPSLAASLSLDTMNGWDRVLNEGSALNEAAIASIDDGLTIVPLEHTMTHEAIGLNHHYLEKAVAQLTEAFDLVLLDVGPAPRLLGESSWLRKLSHKPALLLAHDMRSASMLEVQQTIEHAQASGVEVVGVAQTFASAEAA